MGSARAIRWVFAVLALALVSQTGCDWLAADPPANRVQDIQARRHPANPLITAASSPSLGENINGPSVIRVPAWVEHPLGKYYLYFAHHSGQYIRLAYADSLAGPWTVYEPGTLRLGEAPPFAGHIASPDVHVDDRRREIRMYFHGPVRGRKGQWSGLAVSSDGLRFTATKEVLGKFYFRVWPWRGAWYALAKDWDEGTGELYRSVDGLTGFESQGEFLDRVRHSAVLVRGSDLLVFYTRKGDAPERILVATVDLRPDWRQWVPSAPLDVLKPEAPYEGAAYPIEPSRYGAATHVNQLRDPYVFEDEGQTWLFYTIAGEMGIALAALDIRMPTETDP